jgi:hypothetical protein
MFFKKQTNSHDQFSFMWKPESVLTCSGASQPEVGSHRQWCHELRTGWPIGEPPNDTGWEGGSTFTKKGQVSRLSMEQVSKPNLATKEGKEVGR